MHPVNWNRQLGLAVVLFALGTAAYWHEFKHKPQKEEKEEFAKQVFQLKDTPIQSISVIQGDKKVTLGCSDFAANLCKPNDNSKWEVAEPMKLKADDSNVNSFVTTLGTLNPSNTINLKDETPEKRKALLKEYGLNPEARLNSGRIEIKTAKGITALYLGQSHPLGDSIFAIKEQVPEGKKLGDGVDETSVYLIPTYFKANMERDLTHWRDKKLLSLASHEISSFEVEGTQGRISGERRNGQWLLRSGKNELPGDPDSIDALLNASIYLSARQFVSNSKKDAVATTALKGFTPTLKLTLQKEKGNEKTSPPPTLLILYKRNGDQNSKVFATVSTLDPLVEVESSIIARLNKSVKDLRLMKLLTSMERFGTKHLEFSGAALEGNSIKVENKNGKWQNSSDQKAVLNEKVLPILEKLGSNQIKDFLTGAAASAAEKGSQKEELKIVLGDEQNPSLRQFLFWKKDGNLYAKDLARPAGEIYLMNSMMSDVLPWKNDFFKESPMKNETTSDNSKK